jgi:hypothetical protein
VKHGTLYSVCVLTFLVWGCPKRQAINRIVYVPAAPSSAESTGQGETDALVIEEPQPAEPIEPQPAEQPPSEPAPARRRSRPLRTDSAAPAETILEPEPAPAVEIPALEPRESPGQQAAQRQQIVSLQNQVHARIRRLENANLPTGEHNMLEDARTFLTQSERALAGSDFQRARNLARKASMLVAVLEQE